MATGFALTAGLARVVFGAVTFAGLAETGVFTLFVALVVRLTAALRAAGTVDTVVFFGFDGMGMGGDSWLCLKTILQYDQILKQSQAIK
ncbi:MAG: hypothetical protein RBS84_05155 [Kiritimatiellia bacterium]|nr:hypothetical protein [Kiritimatiellia bacterium]